MDSGMGAMENGRGLARIKHAEGAGVIEAVIRLGRAGVFDTEVARQPQGTFIDQGRGTGCAELRIGIRRNCQLATFVDGQGSAAGRVDCHLLERQRRVAGDGGDHELVGGYGRSIHLDYAVEAGRRSAFSLCIAPFVVGAREGDEISVSVRQRQRIKGSQIGGRGQVVGLAGNERTFLVSGRQSVGIIVGDDFQ